MLKYLLLTKTQSLFQDEVGKKLDEIRKMRENMKGIAEDVKTKEEMQKHLV